VALVVATCASARATSRSVARPALKRDCVKSNRILLRADVFVGDGELALHAAKGDVIAGKLGQKGNQRIAAGLDRSLLIGLCRFNGSADSAEDVEFPGGVEAALEGLDFGFMKADAIPFDEPPIAPAAGRRRTADWRD